MLVRTVWGGPIVMSYRPLPIVHLHEDVETVLSAAADLFDFGQVLAGCDGQGRVTRNRLGTHENHNCPAGLALFLANLRPSLPCCRERHGCLLNPTIPSGGSRA